MNKLKLYLFIIGMMLGLKVIAQPAGVQNVAKSVFTLTTFDKDGGVIASTQGVFIDNKGTGITTFKPFVGAVRGTVVDANGKTYDVDAIMGANELYDVAKLHIEATTKGVTLGSIDKGSAWMVPYSVRKPDYKQININRVEKFNTTYNYYVFTTTAPENCIGCPMVTNKGQVIGIMHSAGGTTTAIDATFGNSLHLTGLSTLDPALRQTSIRTSLPDEEKDAMTMMTLKKPSVEEAVYQKYINEYIAKFPTSAFGYRELAIEQVSQDKFSDADKTMQLALQKASNKGEVHSNYSDLIYQKLIYKADKPYEAWTADKALSEAEEAYKAETLPVYQHQQAQIYFLKQDYQKAYDIFMGLTKGGLNNGEVWYEAAQSKTHLNAPADEIKTLLDSAITVGARTGNPAPYVLARGAFYDKQGKYREAVLDYMLYDSIAAPMNVEFFYTRYRAEYNAKMWQLALLDIARCCLLKPAEPGYFAEWASLDVRVGRYKEAISAAKKCVELDDKSKDGYLLLGIALANDKQKEEALKNLRKAKELGDPRADEQIKKYSK